VDDPSALVTSLPELLSAADIAAVLLRLQVTDQRTMIARIKTLAPAIQNAGAALLLDGHVELVARAGADFVLVEDAVWADARGPAAALADLGQAIRDAHAAAHSAKAG
jgi:thiamine monophosphate synthase